MKAKTAKDILLAKDKAKLKQLQDRLPGLVKKHGERHSIVLKCKHDIEKVTDKVYMRQQDIRYSIKNCTFPEAIERLLLQVNEHQEELIKLTQKSANLMERFQVEKIKQWMSPETWAALEEANGFVKQMVEGVENAGKELQQEYLDRINAFEPTIGYYDLVGFQFELAEGYGGLQGRWEEEVFRSTELFAEKVEILNNAIAKGATNV